MSDEGYVQVNPDSTGKKIRDITVELLQPDNTIAVVAMQVVSISDKEGRLLNFDMSETNDLLRQVVSRLDKLVEIQAAANEMFVSED